MRDTHGLAPIENAGKRHDGGIYYGRVGQQWASA
jgi:hypothetical protein